MNFLSNFADPFFFILSLICALLTFIDWAIGPKARAAIRERLADWWIRLQYITFAGLVAEDAGKIRP